MRSGNTSYGLIWLEYVHNVMFPGGGAVVRSQEYDAVYWSVAFDNYSVFR